MKIKFGIFEKTIKVELTKFQKRLACIIAGILLAAKVTIAIMLIGIFTKM